MHITALKQAMSSSIKQGDAQVAFVINVDNPRIFDELRQQLEILEKDRAFIHNPGYLDNKAKTSGLTQA